MTNAYDAWEAAKAALAWCEIAEGLRNALELSVSALREPAKIARVSALLRTYDAIQEGGPYDTADGMWAWRDSAAAQIAAALEEFEASAPALTDQQAEIAERVDNALRAMKHLNYTGEHTHFEVLDDVRTVLAEVLQGRAIPLLERFRCPSLLQIASNPDDPVQTVRCALQLPHECKHVAELGQTWDDQATLQIKQEALQAMQPHVDVPPEPGHVLKPAADRLHELVSYGVQMEASNRTVEYPCPDAADAYQDMHSKLAEILKEGGI